MYYIFESHIVTWSESEHLGFMDSASSLNIFSDEGKTMENKNLPGKLHHLEKYLERVYLQQIKS